MKYSIYTTASAILFGLVGYLSIIIIKNTNMDAFNLMFWRFSFSSLVYTIFFLLIIKEKFFDTNRKINTIGMVLTNVLFYVPSCILCFYASITIGIGLGIVSFFSFPVFIALLSWYFEKTPPNQIVIMSIILVLSGITLIAPNIDKQAIRNVIGVSYGLAAAFTFACYVMSMRRIVSNGHEQYTSCISCISCSLACLLILIVRKNIHIPSNYIDWGNLALLAIFATVIPTYLLIVSINKISANQVAVLSSLEPVFAILLGTILLNESISGIQYLGISLVISGSIMIQFEKNRTPIENAKEQHQTSTL